MTWFLKNAHSVLAKKIINQTVDFVGGLVLGAKKKTEKPICSDFVFSFVSSADYQYNFQNQPVFMFSAQCCFAKKIAEPICSDFAFSFVIRADFQETKNYSVICCGNPKVTTPLGVYMAATGVKKKRRIHMISCLANPW